MVFFSRETTQTLVLVNTFSITGYVGVNVTVSDRRVGFSHVICTGNAKGLEECIIGNLTSHNCSEVGIVQCFNGIYYH